MTDEEKMPGVMCANFTFSAVLAPLVTVISQALYEY